MHASWVEIAPDIIANNLIAAREYLAPHTRFCAVLKADAYGHGIDIVLPALMQNGVDFIGITSNNEAGRARACGYTGRIMRLRTAVFEEAAAGLDFGIEELVASVETAHHLSALGRISGRPMPVHLSINAGGMGRDGLELSSTTDQQACLRILQDNGLRIAGLMTHFPSNLPDDLIVSRKLFQSQVDWVFNQSGLKRDQVIIHAGSSLTLMAGGTQEYDMVRCGAVLYGIVGPRTQFQEAMALKSRVTSINHCPKGANVGYDHAHQLTRNSRLASVSIGYANGYRRLMANCGNVVIRGVVAPILGKISMNALVVDVTDIPDVRAGDTVVLFGDKLDPLKVEHQSQTILADLYVDWGRANARQIVGPNRREHRRGRT